jgi:hypothetical protein
MTLRHWLMALGSIYRAGILNTKEFMVLRGAWGENWSSLVRPAVRCQADMPLLAGLRLLQERRMFLAIVYAESDLAGGRDLGRHP